MSPDVDWRPAEPGDGGAERRLSRTAADFGAGRPAAEPPPERRSHGGGILGWLFGDDDDR